MWAGCGSRPNYSSSRATSAPDAPAGHDERLAALDALDASLPTASGEADAYRALTAAERTRLAATPAAAPWQTAAEAARAARSPYLLAYAAVRLAEAHAALGDRDAAGAAVAEAIALADALGAAPLANEARALARRARLEAGAPEPGEAADPFGLTSREAEVLRLVADGRSNGQIAESLFISRKTASVHVSNILGKLGVASRGEAAAVAHRHRLT